MNQRPSQTIVFVHGAWHGAWCWDEWISFFNARGYNAVAVELRGHGYKTGSYRHARIQNYVTDVRGFIDQLEMPPILVGHSLGCSIVQQLITDDKFPAAVLVAPIPEPLSFRKVFISQLCRHPWLFIRSILAHNMKPWVSHHNSEKLFFSKYMDGAKAKEHIKKMQGESLNLFVMDLMKKIPRGANKTPVLLIGAEEDSFFSIKAQRVTARQIAAEFMIAYSSGHDVMLDVMYEQVAEEIALWINTKLEVGI